MPTANEWFLLKMHEHAILRWLKYDCGTKMVIPFTESYLTPRKLVLVRVKPGLKRYD